MATTVFPNEPPLLLDFEKPEEMMQQQRMAEAEMQRRGRGAKGQYQGGKRLRRQRKFSARHEHGGSSAARRTAPRRTAACSKGSPSERWQRVATIGRAC